MNIAAKSPNRAAIGDARGGLGPNSSELRSSSTTVSIEEVEVGAVDSGGDPLFGLIPRVVGGAPDVDRVLPEQ